MACGLYGKLTAKRDFIAESVSRGFLDVFEPWLQGGISASRITLGARWQAIYYAAPIWRFWLAPGYCGASVLGALMPSIDGVGRPFPLLLVATAPPGQAFAPPQADPREDWFASVEDLLLSTLEEGRDFESVLADLHGLPEPATILPPQPPEGLHLLADGTLRVTATEPAEGLLKVLARLDQGADHAQWGRGCVFWTLGGQDIPAQALVGLKLPAVEQFAGLMNGVFETIRPQT
ncbi:type VI secretion system-associated protein TagF [Ancylobacter sp. 6x-1]|uniref:Type VI secretion system-associated protein TagF n=1 Tax=Ancylobacter crimeensis TaxID=2579147 RepID=A0ABT0D802_9HYPH|nr:type VI secretion system-associated protein TagF [Ancylobacter crimeensis]MCK0195917.1 type VI secretion system-associated protein TagF [Ancylobacter crimeensis]